MCAIKKEKADNDRVAHNKERTEVQLDDLKYAQEVGPLQTMISVLFMKNKKKAAVCNTRPYMTT